MSEPLPAGTHAGRLGRLLPAWPAALAVIAHQDDESFGLGSVIGELAAAGTAVHILCYSHGEAHTLNETRADLRSVTDVNTGVRPGRGRAFPAGRGRCRPCRCRSSLPARTAGGRSR
jgi:hypothetical protein